MSKACKRCGETKESAGFSPEPNNLDGLRGICRACKNTRQNQLRAERHGNEATERRLARKAELVGSGVKRCGSCTETKPFSEFGMDSRAATGRKSYCRKCNSRLNRIAKETPQRAKRRGEQERYRAGGPKTCSMCGTEKEGSLEYYGKCGHTRDKLQSTCRACIIIRQTEARYLKDYGMTVGHREVMLADQGGACAICHKTGKVWVGSNHGWNVDHSHVTGKVRGILCGPCNVGIGNLQDDMDILASAIAYLKLHAEETEVAA